VWIPLACKLSEGSIDKYDRQDAICLSFKFFYGWTPFVCRCARRGAGARIGRGGAGGGGGARKVVSRRDEDEESDGGSGCEEEDEGEGEGEESVRHAGKRAR
jgi:hypothetical protein